MKKRIAVLVVTIAACHSAGGAGRTGGPAPSSASPKGSATGASSAQMAVTAYLASIKAKDLQAMSAVWGSSSGSVRETMDRAQMEKRETTIMGLICFDEFRISSETPGVGPRKLLHVELKRASKTTDLTMTTVPGPASRWYVEDIDLGTGVPQRLQAFCR